MVINDFEYVIVNNDFKKNNNYLTIDELISTVDNTQIDIYLEITNNLIIHRNHNLRLYKAQSCGNRVLESEQYQIFILNEIANKLNNIKQQIK